MKSDREAILEFWKNPLDENVKLPKQLHGLEYSNVMCGVIRGSLEAVPLTRLI